jgi:hypothetical protein
MRTAKIIMARVAGALLELVVAAVSMVIALLAPTRSAVAA